MFDLFKLHDSKKDISSRTWIKLGGKGVYSLRTPVLKNKKFLDYFIKGTIKYKKAEFFVKNKTNIDIFNIFNEKPHSKTSLNKILELVRKLKIFTISKIRNKSKLSDGLLRNYLKVLIMTGFIKEIKKKSKFDIEINSANGFDNTTAIRLNKNFKNKLFNDLANKYEIYEIAKIMGTNPSTVTNWRLSNNRINKNYLLKMLELSDLKENDLCTSIESINKNLYIINL